MTRSAVRVFLDSNIILSGLFSDRGSLRILLDVLSLNLPIIIGVTVYKEYIGKLNLRIVPIPAMEEVKKYAGATAAKDIPVLVSAINGKADYLITGDKKDFGKLKGDYPFQILSPSDFLEHILPENLGRLEKTE
jgi:predicted nucleic acid-binding protein